MTEIRRYQRSADRVVAGVAAGLAEQLGLPVVVVRLAFVGLAFYNGFGIALYLAYWAVVPSAARPEREESPAALVAAIAAGLAVLAVVRLVFPDSFFWQVALGLVGLFLIWRQADEGRSGFVNFALALAGGLMLLVALAAIIVTNGGFLVTVVVLLFAVAVGWPWWRRLATDLGRERRARIRSQERAEVAAHLHDSVLQTLALIQRQAASPREVQRLARRQERELRSWMGGHPADPEGTLAGAVRAVADQIEEEYDVLVDVVVVGDAPVGDRVAALVQAAREALVNAAKHSGAQTVSVYVEVEREKVTGYVRDRGRGFDPAAATPGRYGLAESVVGRMERFGGRASVHSAPGEGTEIELELPR